MVTVVVPLCGFGDTVTEVGEKLQLLSVGNPVQPVKLTVPLKPPMEATFRVIVPELPGPGMFTELYVDDILKSGGGFTVSEIISPDGA
jgi:hypothetical protein